MNVIHNLSRSSIQLLADVIHVTEIVKKFELKFEEIKTLVFSGVLKNPWVFQNVFFPVVFAQK